MTQRKRRDNIFAFYPELGKNAVGNPVKALEILPKALNAFRKAGRYDMQAETYYYMAESYFLTGNAPQVVSNATQAISLISQHNVKQEFLPRCYNMMGIGYSSAGEYNMSQQYYLEAMKYAKLFKDDRTALSIRNNIGSLFLQMGDYEEAAVYMNSVYELASMRLADPEYGMLTSDEQKNRRETFYVTMLNMADISYHEGNYDVALRYLKQLESALKGEAFFRYINSIYTIRVKIYLSMDDMVNVKRQ